MRICVIGGGMAGILSAIKLEDAGFDDVVVYEKAEGLGGTWRANTYPGISCDVPSHLYSYSFAPNASWSHVFAPGSEILAYLETVAAERSVYGRVRMGTEVTSLRFAHGRWELSTSTGEIDHADAVIAATGVLHHPSYPDIDAVGDFAGDVFHSSAWDHDVSIEDKRVGVIGTGSSAVQIVSAVVDTVGELSLFQRTAQWIMPMENPIIDDDDKERYNAHPELMKQLRDDLGRMFEDNFANAVVDADSPQVKLIQEMCSANLENNVRDPLLREKLRPDYRAACKRLIISPDFYSAIQRPNAHLVTEPILRVEPEGIRTADGVLHRLDVLVLATGFRVDRFMRPMRVEGRNSVNLDDIWEKRPCAYLSISIPDFPNLFMLNGPNGPVGNFSLIDVAELQLGYVMQLLGLLADGKCRELSATHEAMNTFEKDRAAAARRTVWMTGCRSWYLDDRGVPAVWPWSFARFREEMSKPDLAHFELSG
jgi:cation diffusion facilitator CzcD-associated flavoprotein CzcO